MDASGLGLCLHMGETFDVAVIGAGLAGMLAAAILARRGARVVLLERERQVGGRLRSYEVDGFVVDAGSYLWPNAHLDDALAAAGADGFCGSTVPADQVMRMFVEGEGGRRFVFPWPGRSASERMRKAARVALRADEEVLDELGRLWKRLAALPDEEVDGYEGVPLREALPAWTDRERVREAFARNVMLFGTYDPGSASAAECIRLVRRPATARRPRPECAGANEIGGVRALAHALRGALERSGVDLRLGRTVEQIAVAGGRVRGVVAHGGEPWAERIEAPVVVCNAPVWQLFDLISTARFPPAFVEEALSWAVVGGVVAAAFAFEGLPRLRDGGQEDRFLGWTRLLFAPDAGFGGGLLWSSLHSPRNAPPGRSVLQAMRLTPRHELADAERVAAIHRSFERLVLDEIYEDARERLLWSRFWLTRDGSEYMISAARRPPVEPPGPTGLFLVGETTDVGGVQMDAAALSALRCAELIRRGG